MQDILKINDNLSSLESVESIMIGKSNHNSPIRRPFFTIAIPTYKRANLLKEALDSALNQDFYDYNIIICDNNPERYDETEILLDEYMDNPKITYYKHTQNVGMAGNWYKCAMLSNSNNVVLLHDDDIIYPFALSVFHKALSYVEDDWSLIKPNLDKFNTIDKKTFRSDHKYILSRVEIPHFIPICAIGAPTCILLNKKKVIEIGTVDPSRFPCIDYEMSLKLAYYGKAYRLSGEGSLGGYRIGKNESLSESTMEKFFVQRSRISKELMKFLKIPNFCINTLDSIFEDAALKSTKEFYNMPEYQIKYKKRSCKILSNIVFKLYRIMIKRINIKNKEILFNI